MALILQILSEMPETKDSSCGANQKNIINPNHHYFPTKYRNTLPISIAIRLQFVSQHFRCPYALRKGTLRLPFVLRPMPPICIAVLLGNLGGCGHWDIPRQRAKGATTTCNMGPRCFLCIPFPSLCSSSSKKAVVAI